MRPLGSRLAASVRVAVGLLGLVGAAGALAVAQGSGRSTTYAGTSSGAAVLELAAGVGLIAAGLITSFAGRPGRTGDLALLAGVAWFAPVWIAWQAGPPLVRSLAALLVGLTFAFLFDLVLSYPDGRTRSAPVRALVVVVYVEAVASAAGLALFRDPYLDPACWANCTVNSLLLRSYPSSAQALEAADRWFVTAAAVTLVAICLGRLAGSSRTARRRLFPVAGPGILYAGAVTARAIALQRTTVEDPFDTSLRAIFVVAGVGVVLLSCGLVWAVARARLERRAVARVVAELDEAPAPGSLQTALASALGDPELRVAYRLPGGPGRYVDAGGREIAAPVSEPGRTVTRVVTNEHPIALVSHAGPADELEGRLGPAIRLALANEQLQAEVLAQLEELRSSRARIVENGDAERRRLERDLHDGAQQRLLALTYDLRLARASAEAGGDASCAATLAAAADEAQAALGDLRDLAHGIYPAILAEAGLASALASLADEAPLPVELGELAPERFGTPVETAAYVTVAEAIDDAARRGATFVAAEVARAGGSLTVATRDDGAPRSDGLVHLADRVGALGGSLALGPATLHAEIPCA